MAKEISALELRQRFGEVMEEVRYRKEPCIVKRNGRRMIVLLDIEAYEALKDQIEKGPSAKVLSPELRRLAEDLRTRYKGELQQILFFGSRARGQATAESDYDCLLVFKKVTPALRKNLDRLAAEWLLERRIVFSYVAVSESDLPRLEYEPFFQNARREGLWA